MKTLALLLSAAVSLAAASAIAAEHDVRLPEGASITVPRSASLKCNPHKQKDNWGNAVEKDRKQITIRASENDRDDISDDFLWAIKKANNGGLLHLEKGKTYVIGKKLDLSFLKDVYVKIDGEVKVSCPYISCHSPSICDHWQSTALTARSSPTTSRTGKPTTSSTRSRTASPSGSGVESELSHQSTSREQSTDM